MFEQARPRMIVNRSTGVKAIHYAIFAFILLKIFLVEMIEKRTRPTRIETIHDVINLCD